MGEGRTSFTSAELLSDYQNPTGGRDMLVQAVKELPSAAKELAYEAWQNPVDTAISVGKTVGTGAVMGAALGYLIPGRGTVAAIIGTAFTIPAAINTYKHFNHAYQAAQNSNADVNAIAKAFAKDALVETGNFALGTAGGLIGSEIGRGIAMSRTPVGEFGQSVQRLVLKAENKAYDTVSAMFSRSSQVATEAGAPTSGRLEIRDLDSAIRKSGAVNTRDVDRVIAATPEGQLPAAPSAKEMEMVYGSLHGHSVYSDGMGKPAEIYAKAREQGLQFTAITDHNHKAARGGVQPGDPRYPGHQKNPTVADAPEAYTETIWAANQATKPGEFVGLSGVEVGTIGKVGSTSKGGVNHINILEVPDFFESVRSPRQGFAPPNVIKVADGDMKAIVTHLDGMKDSTGGRPVIQLNHPRYGADESPNLDPSVRGRDYGQKSFKSQKEWRERFGKYASQIELINGEAISPKKTSVESRHIHADDFAGYIDKGLHLSPTFGRDFHYGDPGGTNAATGILVKQLDRPSLMDALRERRTIATTNKELLSGRMTANDQQMGSILDQQRHHDVNVKAHVGGKVTPDAKYTVNLWGDAKIGDKNLAEIVQSKVLSGSELKAAGNTVSFDTVQHTIGAKSAYFLEIQRLGSGSAIPERMWTAPVWVEPDVSTGSSLAINALIGLGATTFQR